MTTTTTTITTAKENDMANKWTPHTNRRGHATIYEHNPATGEYRCTVCGAVLERAKQLGAHSRNHGGDRPGSSKAPASPQEAVNGLIVLAPTDVIVLARMLKTGQADYDQALVRMSAALLSSVSKEPADEWLVAMAIGVEGK